MREVIFEKENALFRFDYHPNVVDFVKAIPGRRFDWDKRIWMAPTNALGEKEIEILKSFGFSIGGKAAEAESEESAKQMRTDYRVPEGTVKATLREYQHAGIEYALKHPRCLIADEMGTGKTLQAITATILADAMPCLVICPASLKYNWKKEVQRWSDKVARVMEPWDDPRSEDLMLIDDRADFYVINYDIAHKMDFSSLGLKSVICDESHYLKTKTTRRSKSVEKILDLVERIIFLSGTPVTNRPAELVNQLRLLGALDHFGGYWNFVRRYCGAYRDNFGLNTQGAQNLPELSKKLRENVMIRREKSQVLKELPEKSRAEIEVEITNRRDYEKAERDIVQFLKETEGTEVAMRAKAAEALVKIEKLKQLTAQGKMKALQEWVEDFLETGKKLVIFAIHQDVIAQIKELYKCRTITGSVSAEDRQRAVDDFQSDPETKILALNIKAGGVGITLTAASDVLFLEMGWSAGEMDQAEDRCHRIGQHSNVACHYLIGKDTIDERIYALIEDKRTIYRGAMGEENQVKKTKTVFFDLLKGFKKRVEK